jgi:hypothetical protein
MKPDINLISFTGDKAGNIWRNNVMKIRQVKRIGRSHMIN